MLLKIRVPFGILNVIYLILRRIFLFIHKKPPTIPPSTNPLFTLSAAALARKIRQREITSYVVVDAYIERIKEVNNRLNAVVENRFGDAIVEAKICDEQLRAGKYDVETLEREKPLFGVPFTVKESCALKGCSYTGGSLARKGIKADDDGEGVELLRNAGAIPVCVTNTPEMCSGFDSTNLLYGHTSNPYDTRYSAGGSSGGEGALLGAGATVIGIGSDLAGSIRVPACFNGVFGHKATSGILSNAGHLPPCEDKVFQKLFTIGPMTRYAEDLGLLMRVLTSKCEHKLRLDVPVDLRQLKVYYREGLDDSFGVLPVSTEVKQCVLRAANHFTRHGVCAEELPIEWPVTITEIVITGLLTIQEPPKVLLDVDPKLRKNVTTEMWKALLGCSSHTKQMLFLIAPIETHFPFSESNISHYTKKGEALRQKLLDLLGENGILIYPTWRTSTFLPEFVICEMLSASSCALFNLFGFPAVQVPMGLNRDGLPLGIQVIAAPYQDRLCLAVAKELETAFGGWIPPSAAIRG